jgi:hypothetical protein
MRWFLFESLQVSLSTQYVCSVVLFMLDGSQDPKQQGLRTQHIKKNGIVIDMIPKT